MSILKAKPGALRGSLKDRILHSLINGPIDADKVDYLMRDCAHLGLTFGKAIDLERLVRCLTIVFRQKGESTYAALGIHEKGKIPAEAIAFARYAMFGQVYWHHAYRSIKAMIHRMVWEVLSGQQDDEGRTKVRNAFRQFVSGKDEEGRLFPTRDELPAGPIRRSDLMVLEWFSQRGGADGETLFELIKHRRLFKRVATLSRERAHDENLLERLAEVYRPTRKDWRTKLRLQQVLQRRIVEMIEHPTQPPAVSFLITPDARNSFIVAGKNGIVILMDMPPDRQPSDTMLELVVEEDRRAYKSDEIRTGSFEKSVVWTSLQHNFYDSLGKVRVFCHPDHASFLSAFLARDAIENALSAALQEVEEQ